MEKQIFVARERELNELDGFLKKALSQHGTVCFVTGEAGSGKTTLVSEFARRTQEQHADLAVAVGTSDAQTGAGDAHLPFREVLGQLTGDVDAKVAQGAITSENAKRLHKLLAMSGEILMDVGPDLIDIFVPGSKLVARAGTLVMKKVGWLDNLEIVTSKKQAGKLTGEAGIEPSQIYEQYTKVICKLSEKCPLLVVLDDLQWADTASIELLFRLARRIEGHRILLVGTYRPEDVAIGRSGERHPMEKVLAELKRYYGDITLDLNQAEQDEGKQFVNALINTEPNLLGEEFCKKLYQHTGGHPLFTIELLRNMQERGALARDDQGRWIETPALDWQSLPKRVEGVIDERIGRLGSDARRVLTVASVEGEEFTAEAVARVEKIDVRGLISMLGTEMERQHRLVKSIGLRRVDATGQRLSLYQFQHNIIQKYLYNQLNQAERAYLHEDIGNALEDFFGSQVDEIVVQLARHFSEAGITHKACTYLEMAGKQAANRFANNEAITYFNRALDLTPKDKIDQRFALLLEREQIYAIKGERELQAHDLTELLELALASGDHHKRTEVTVRRAKYAWEMCDYPSTIAAAKGVVHLAKPIQDSKSQITGYYLWAVAAQYQGDTETAHRQIEKALNLSRTAGLKQMEADSLRALGVIIVNQGDFDKAKKYLEQSLQIYREQGAPRGEGKTLNNLGAIFTLTGDYNHAKDSYQQVLSIFQETGDRLGESIAIGNLGDISAQQGDLPAARAYYEQSQRISHEVADREGEAAMFGNLGEISTALGDLAEAKAYLEQGLRIAREIGLQRNESNILSGLAYNLTLQGDYSKAGELCGQALKLGREIDEPWCEAESLNKLGIVCDCVGYSSKAGEMFEKALQIASTMGIKPLEGDAQANMGLLYHHLGEDERAREYCQQALETACALGTRISEAKALTHLGHTLVGLNLLPEATEAYQKSLHLRREMGQLNFTVEPLAGLARISLIQRKPAEAQGFIDEILGFLEERTLDGTQEPTRIYLTCYQVLVANHDPRAKDVLIAGFKMLQKRATKINNENMRHSYLENVSANREINQEFARMK